MSMEMVLLSFIFYSFLGWFYESTVCSIVSENRFLNRGFLLGPYCPVYGFGAILSYQCLHTASNPFIMFVAAMFLCTGIEYITGYVMEKVFQTRWWDYSHFPFQIHGHVCLYGALIFGFACLLVIYIVEPAFLILLQSIESHYVQMVAIAASIFFAIDMIVTFLVRMNLNRDLTTLHKKLFKQSDELLEELSIHALKKVPPQLINKKSGLRNNTYKWNIKLKKGEQYLLSSFFNIRLRGCDGFPQKLGIGRRIRNTIEKFR